MLFPLQRIRQLEDMIEMQKRQVKEIEEKVYMSCRVSTFHSYECGGAWEHVD